MKKQIFTYTELYCKNCEEIVNEGGCYELLGREDINGQIYNMTEEEFEKGRLERRRFSEYCGNCMTDRYDY